jgi:hypothetical protein
VGPAGRSRSLWFLKSIPILSPIRRHSALYLKEQEMRRGFPRISCGVWWRWRTSLAFLTESRTRHVRCSVQEIRSPIVNPCTPKSRTWGTRPEGKASGEAWDWVHNDQRKLGRGDEKHPRVFAVLSVSPSTPAGNRLHASLPARR